MGKTSGFILIGVGIPILILGLAEVIRALRTASLLGYQFQLFLTIDSLVALAGAILIVLGVTRLSD